MMNVIQFYVNSRTADRVSFDLPDIDEYLQVFVTSDGCAVYNPQEKTAFTTTETDAFLAVKSYLDWMLGTVYEWVEDENEGFGCFKKTDAEEWASEFFMIVQQKQTQIEIITER